MSGALEMFVVYDSPRDYPRRFVVRKWIGVCPMDPPVAVVDSLEEARSAVPAELVRLDRHPHDDLAIREVWL